MPSRKTLKIATFNVNGIRTRLPHLLQWLGARNSRTSPACRSSRRPTRAFPSSADPRRRLRRDLAGAALVERRRRSSRAGREPIEIRRGLPGDPRRRAEPLSRGRGARHRWSVACTCPTATRSPARSSTTSCAWFERLHRARRRRWSTAAIRWCWPATSTSCPPTIRHLQPALLAQGRAAAAGEPRVLPSACCGQGWLDALRTQHPEERIYTFWDYFRQHWQRDAGLRIDHLLLNEQARRASSRRAWTAGCAAWRRPATTRRRGSR